MHAYDLYVFVGVRYTKWAETILWWDLIRRKQIEACVQSRAGTRLIAMVIYMIITVLSDHIINVMSI